MPLSLTPLEDLAGDVAGTAARGLGLDGPALAARAGVTEADARAVLAGAGTDDAGAAVCVVLGLHWPSFRELRDGRWQPPAVELPGVVQLVSEFAPGMTVNAWLLLPPGSSEALLVDTGTDLPALGEALAAAGRTLAAILVTHTHPDHIQVLEGARALPGAPEVVASRRAGLAVARAVEHGWSARRAGLEIAARAVPGHAEDGLAYVVEGLGRPVAAVGDALFAASAGGAPGAWREALRHVREQILLLPPETVLLPGHGPATTVAHERAHNPLFAA